MKNTTALFLIFIGSLLLPLKAVCQNERFEVSKPMLYSEVVPKFMTQAQADSIIAKYNRPLPIPTFNEFCDCNQVIIIDGIKINDSTSAIYDGKYFILSIYKPKTEPFIPTLTEYGYHFERSDIREMADWKELPSFGMPK